MKTSKLWWVVAYLEKALKSLPHYDKRLGESLAEYFVAYQIAKRGLKVQVWDERDNTNADIFLPDQRKRVEVKSSIFDGGAAFGFNVNQLTEPKFDYCVLIEFHRKKKDDGWHIKNSRVMSSKEMNLNEIIERGNKVRKLYLKGSKKAKKEAREWAAHPETNPYLLYTYQNLQEYKEIISKWRTKIEIDLHKRPNKYNNRWDKIRG